MTCVDKLRELHPDWDEKQITQYTIDRCPEDEYIAKEAAVCAATMDCVRCWNREFFEVDEDMPCWRKAVYFKADDIRRLERLEKRLNKSTANVIGAALKLYEDGLNAVAESRQRGTTSMSFELKED